MSLGCPHADFACGEFAQISATRQRPSVTQHVPAFCAIGTPTAIMKCGCWFHLALGLGKFLEEFPFMTWKRVATALVLIPVVVGLVLFTPTWVVAMATAAITVLALWEYFALGDAIGHRAYRLWTTFCALLIVFAQWRVARNEVNGLFKSGYPVGPDFYVLSTGPFTLADVLMLYVLGIAVLTLFTKRPLVESLPAA